MNEENQVDYKEAFYFGLNYFKDDLEFCQNSELYYPIVKYFTYPLNIMLDEIEAIKLDNKDTQEFYNEKCDELQKLYNRLIITMQIVAEKCKPSKGVIGKLKKYYNKVVYRIHSI